MKPRTEVARTIGLAVLSLALALAVPPSNANASDPRAAQLAARADELLDAADSDAKKVEEAGALIGEAIALDPESPRLRAVQARQVLRAGTTDEGIRPSALHKANGILTHAALEMQPPDARALAWLARTRMQLNEGNAYWALKRAQNADPMDPWVQYASAEDARNNPERQAAYLEGAIAAGLRSAPELRSAYDVLLPRYMRQHDRAKFDAAYAARAMLDPTDPLWPDSHARNLVVHFQDFEVAERFAREALAMSDFPHAHQTLSLALYGQWAVAARDGKGPDVIEALYRKAQAHDPGARMIPACLAEWEPLQFIYTRLARKNIHRQDMHQC